MVCHFLGAMLHAIFKFSKWYKSANIGRRGQGDKEKGRARERGRAKKVTPTGLASSMDRTLNGTSESCKVLDERVTRAV